MKYNFFANLTNNYSGPIDNISPYQDFFSSVDIVPNDVIIQNIGKDNLGKKMIASCITSKGLILNFSLGNFFVDGVYKDYLCGVYYIYNDKYYFLRNFGFDKNMKPTCIVDFYDYESLSFLRKTVSDGKELIEPKDFSKYGLKPDVTFSVTLEEFDKNAFASKEDDLISMISKMAFDKSVRIRN